MLPEAAGLSTVLVVELSELLVVELPALLVAELSALFVVELPALLVAELPELLILLVLLVLPVLSLPLFAAEFSRSPEHAENVTANIAAEKNANSLFFIITFLSSICLYYTSLITKKQ